MATETHGRQEAASAPNGTFSGWSSDAEGSTLRDSPATSDVGDDDEDTTRRSDSEAFLEALDAVEDDMFVNQDTIKGRSEKEQNRYHRGFRLVLPRWWRP